MKKFQILLLLPFSVLAFTSCNTPSKENSKSSDVSSTTPTSTDGTSSTGDNSSSDSSDISSKESSDSTTPVADKTTLSDFSYALKTSNPTKIVTNITYFYQSENIILTYNSVLKISYGTEIKSSYNYTYQKLNELTSSSDEMISTYSGTIYTKGSNTGDLLEDGSINWVTSTQGSLSLFKFKISAAYFNAGYIVGNNTLSTSINRTGVEYMFENKDYTGQISNPNLEMIIDDNKQVSSIDFNYLSLNDKLGSNPKVSITNKYTYNEEIVEF